MAGYHGNKGTVSRVTSEEDMPFLPDGTPVDIMLNPSEMPSRMNIGQVLELRLGMTARRLGIYVITPAFDGITDEDVWRTIREAGVAGGAKTVLYDGRTGEPFGNRISVGVIYMIKLAHMADDKLHARLIEPYSFVAQQPLGDKAQFDKQRFEEMEIQALEVYDTTYALQGTLAYESDDIAGRAETYKAIVKNELIPKPGVPESFQVLVRELQSLDLGMRILNIEKVKTKLRDVDDDGDDLAIANAPTKLAEQQSTKQLEKEAESIAKKEAQDVVQEIETVGNRD